MKFLFLLLCTASMAVENASPRLLVHILDYLALDYPGAVDSSGKVLDAGEYAEMKEFAKSARAVTDDLEKLKSNSAIKMGLADLQKLVGQKAAPAKIAEVSAKIKAQVFAISGLENAPHVWPDRGNGKAIYAQNCTSCHGVNGKGDGPSGRTLDPKPTNFHDGSRMKDISPFQAFNAIRLGIEGTGMAAFGQLTDREVWDLSFYIVSLRHEEKSPRKVELPNITLTDLASKTDATLMGQLPGTEEEKKAGVHALRTREKGTGSNAEFVHLAQSRLDAALFAYQQGDLKEAKMNALTSYLDGVEPIEPRLRANNPRFVSDLEAKMMGVRIAIEKPANLSQVDERIREAKEKLGEAISILESKVTSPWVTFSVACGIVLREALEAALILITLLGVVRSMGSKTAAMYVHGGWLLAMGVGVLAWIFSGWVMAISGAQREILEGSISFLAVAVLLYFGYWLHRRTEIGKWRTFISDMVKSALDKKSLFGLGVISFMAVFREAFETVLFLRALLLEAGPEQVFAMTLGVGISLAAVFLLSTIAIRFSARIPIRQLFSLSSVILIFLSLVLLGKGVHAFQESGLLPITPFPMQIHIDLIGLYPTFESIVPQVVLMVASVVVWRLSRRVVS